MSTMQQFHQGMSQIWGALIDGWRELYHPAANALTRFSPHTGFSTLRVCGRRIGLWRGKGPWFRSRAEARKRRQPSYGRLGYFQRYDFMSAF